MKIGLQNIMPHYKPISDSKPQTAKTPAAHKTTKNFDGIMISSDLEVSPEQQFASTLTGRVSMELRKPVTPDRIAELQQKIDQGTYEVDVNAIADKIMLY